MNFCSDNVTEVCPEIMAALIAANEGAMMPYGGDEYTQRLEAKFSSIFETPVTVFPVATGSTANALTLSAIAPSYGAIYCHSESHINVDECGAPEFYTGGAKLVTLNGTDAQIHPSEFFNQDLAKTFAYRRKRSGNLFSKMRYLSCQLEAYITDDLWLKNAFHANQMATRLAQGLVDLPLVKLCHPVEANEVFAEIPKYVVNGLRGDGFQFYVWEEGAFPVIRLVTAFNTKKEDVDALLKSIQRHLRVNLIE